MAFLNFDTGFEPKYNVPVIINRTNLPPNTAVAVGVSTATDFNMLKKELSAFGLMLNKDFIELDMMVITELD